MLLLESRLWVLSVCNNLDYCFCRLIEIADLLVGTSVHALVDTNKETNQSKIKTTNAC